MHQIWLKGRLTFWWAYLRGVGGRIFLHGAERENASNAILLTPMALSCNHRHGLKRARFHCAVNLPSDATPPTKESRMPYFILARKFELNVEQYAHAENNTFLLVLFLIENY